MGGLRRLLFLEVTLRDSSFIHNQRESDVDFGRETSSPNSLIFKYFIQNKDEKYYGNRHRKGVFKLHYA